jgi:hypothetical protein
MNTTENNKLIAEFMGYKTYKMNGYLNVEYADNNHRTIQDTHYHTSWDWLMPVVEKIQKLYEECMDYNNQMPEDYYYKVLDKGISTPREIIYKAVVEFIKQYNK